MNENKKILNTNFIPFKIASIYAIFSVLWILFSDQLLYILIKNGDTITKMQTAKGWLFVIISAFMVFSLLRKALNQRLQIEETLRRNEAKFRALAEYSIDATMRFDSQHRHLYVNPIVESHTGIKPQDFIGKSHGEMGFPENLVELWESAIDKVFDTAKHHRIEFFLPNGTWFDWQLIPEFAEDGKVGAVITSARDITERKREENIQTAQLRLREYARDHTVTQLLTKLLFEAETLTGSEIGFYHFLEDDQETIQLQAWSANTMNNMCKTNGEGSHYPLSQAGVWADALRERRPLIHNDYESLPDKKKLPKGHVSIIRELVVPVFQEDKVVAVLGVGNKKTPYTGEDLKTIQRLADLAWETVVRRQTEIALKESEEKYRTFFENSADAMLMLRDGQFFDCNAATVDILGYNSMMELYSKTPWELSPEYQPDGSKSIEKTNEMINKAFASGSYRFEWDHQRKDGSVIPVEVSLTVIPSEGEPVMLVVWRDISDRRLAEAEKERLTLAIEQSAESIVITDTDANIQYVNPAFEKITGYTREEVLGQNPSILKSGEQKDSFYLKIWRTLIGGETWKGRLVNKAKDGKLYTEKASISPVRDASGKVINYVAVKRDITNEILMEKQLQQSQKMESIGTIAGGIAHDFNNILFPIIGMSEMLIEELKADSPEQRYSKVIFKAGQRGSELVKQILAFSRQNEHKIIPVQIQSVLKEVLKLCDSTIPSNIEISKNIQYDCGFVKADPTQIHQIAMNLIMNAYHAVEKESGKITISLKEIELNQKNLSNISLKPGRYARLIVSDTGCGIDSKITDRIFEPYFTTKEQGKGTGLGLSTVYGIVRKYKGDITVFSELEKGSTFNVYLPVKEKRAEPAPKSDVIQTGTERILLVDDEEPIAELVKIILERLGYRVTPFTSSIDALKAFRSNPNTFDLIISDMAMPQLTGDLLSKELKAIRPDIPILICTGFSERMNKDTSYTIDVDGFLMKPIVKSELSKKIREILDKKVFRQSD